MTTVIEMDEKISLGKQLQQRDIGTVIIISTFTAMRIRTYGSNSKMTVQVSFASEGGSGTPVPALSIEVDDIETALARVKNAGIPIEYGPESEPWGVRRFYVRDPFGKLINILQHE